jgi:prephenate dehydrogenase
MIISVVGLGLLGGSLALGLKSKYSPLKVIGVDNNPLHCEQAMALGLTDEILPLKEAVQQSRLVVLATPVNAILQLVGPVLDSLPPEATLIDLGSTKEQICKAVERHAKRDQFVATHPIAGTEYSGPEAAFSALLKQKTMIICEREKSHPDSLQLVEGICHELEMQLRYMNAAEHDLHLAYVSHLSHISSFALSITVLEKEKDQKNIFDMAGSGFSSTVRLAKSSPQMWAPIFIQNTRNISEALDSYIRQLQQFKVVIDEQNQQGSSELMQKANDIRRILK